MGLRWGLRLAIVAVFLMSAASGEDTTESQVRTGVPVLPRPQEDARPSCQSEHDGACARAETVFTTPEANPAPPGSETDASAHTSSAAACQHQDGLTCSPEGEQKLQFPSPLTALTSFSDPPPPSGSRLTSRASSSGSSSTWSPHEASHPSASRRAHRRRLCYL
jgi:hypothetical protein